MQIVFGIMSAVHSAATVEQLARALAPWPVVIHHDFEQSPDFKVQADNVSFVPEPKRTGWAVWGFSEGIMHLLSHCLNTHGADYFQLLSPTCLPVRPVSEFMTHLERSRFDVHIGTAQINRDPDLLVNFGYRAFCAQDSLSFRILQKLRSAYFGECAARREVANLQTQIRSEEGAMSPVQLLAMLATGLARRGWLGRHLFLDGAMDPVVGGTWFGCRRDAGEYLLSRSSDSEVKAFFSKMRIPDEMMFSSLFHNSPFDVGEPNHYVHTFNEQNPQWIGVDDLEKIRRSHRFFARKFHDDPDDPARMQTLKAIGAPAQRSLQGVMKTQSETNPA